ncbi:hypothetical protein EJF18_40006 [Clavispora lusitaniae]|uniref:Uncharacterized protein n=2 Tax=Clavispora lusitaniae TaxID=36911 RepID=C4Y4W7_CLAL4|nr:uncharacterized protein CLUG_03201 [Clavispora lusitaniae ATCC 42720]QFZ27986.1 hypothetical protein EJF14_40006 [Clavispora lusitaniae]EEQ39073.1 predicted protein [Clavispora lusitaniae ATCC 42720]QFZ33650.1 hypothetical protein EJF16_40006 [Clavispora lusitaniae]QFZ39321.1 hypothetical protein EJF15_40006 [Clavispora lusitaniae]QFZ45003.1 hypothetical protein EJF18_40006 [Clavispora lusitaniae]
MNFFCLLLSLCIIHKAISLRLFDDHEFVRIISQLQDCLSNMSSIYTMCLYDNTEFQITRVDHNPIDLETNDALLSDCIDKVSSNYTIQTDLEAILATDDFEETSDVSYTSASGPFGHYEWGSSADIDTSHTNSSQIINGNPVLMSIHCHWDSGSCGSGFNTMHHVQGKCYTHVWNDMARSF